MRGRVVSSPPKAALFVYDLDLLVNYLPGESVDRDMHPVMLFTFDVEFCEVSLSWCIPSALRDHIEH